MGLKCFKFIAPPFFRVDTKKVAFQLSLKRAVIKNSLKKTYHFIPNKVSTQLLKHHSKVIQPCSFIFTQTRQGNKYFSEKGISTLLELTLAKKSLLLRTWTILWKKLVFLSPSLNQFFLISTSILFLLIHHHRSSLDCFNKEDYFDLLRILKANIVSRKTYSGGINRYVHNFQDFKELSQSETSPFRLSVAMPLLSLGI